jgi:ribose-phosphate pyrophosphokinase
MTARPSLSPSDARPPGLSGSGLRLFALEATADFGRAVAETLGEPLSSHEERSFEDGEHKSRPLVAVQNADVFVVQSLH